MRFIIPLFFITNNLYIWSTGSSAIEKRLLPARCDRCYERTGFDVDGGDADVEIKGEIRQTQVAAVQHEPAESGRHTLYDLKVQAARVLY